MPASGTSVSQSSRRSIASQNDEANRAMKYMPQPTMMRNDQNSSGTFGIVRWRPRCTSAWVAWAGSARSRLQQQRVAEIALVRSKSARACVVAMFDRSVCIAA
jgi:hypothetical protein